MSNFIKFDCPRQIGKTTWAINMLKEVPDSIMFVSSLSQLRSMAARDDASRFIEQVRVYSPHVKSLSASLVILDDLDSVMTKKEINQIIMPIVIAKDGLVVNLHTSRKNYLAMKNVLLQARANRYGEKRKIKE